MTWTRNKLMAVVIALLLVAAPAAVATATPADGTATVGWDAAVRWVSSGWNRLLAAVFVGWPEDPPTLAPDRPGSPADDAPAVDTAEPDDGDLGPDLDPNG